MKRLKYPDHPPQQKNLVPLERKNEYRGQIAKQTSIQRIRRSYEC